MNTQIRRLHRKLMETHRTLATRLGRSRDIDEARAILREMEEVNFRVMIAGSLLFTKTTERIDGRIAEVLDRTAEVKLAVKEADDVREIVRGIGRFLTSVDRALDAIKLVV